MDQVMQMVEPGKQFAKDSIRLVKRCTKPDRKGKRLSLFFFFFEISKIQPKMMNNLFGKYLNL